MSVNVSLDGSPDAVLRLADSQLRSFDQSHLPAKSTVCNAVLRVDADRNRLTSFEGLHHLRNCRIVSVNENSFRSIDTRSGLASLAHCTELSELHVRMNNISHVDFVLPNPPMPRPFAALVLLDLSHNLLSTLPRVSPCAGLEVLRLGHNRLGSLDDFGACLPAGLCRLELNDNELSNFCELRELLLCSETMQHVTVDGNPWAAREGSGGLPFDLRVFLAYMLPIVESIDDVPVSEEETSAGAALLLAGDAAGGRDHVNAIIDDDLALRDYLALHCHKTIRMPSPLPDRGAADVTPAARASRAREISMMRDRHEAPAAPAASAAEVEVLSARLKKLSDTVKVLRQYDIGRRRRAARVIQRQVRCFLLLQQLTVRDPRLRRIGRFAKKVTAARTAVVRTETPPPTTNAKAMDAALRQMWAELRVVRGYLASQRVHAARTIQKHWRAFVARRRCAAIRRDFRRFAERFTPAVTKLQRVARHFLNRLRFRRRLAELREKTQLLQDVSTLKAQMRDMQALVLAMNQQLQSLSTARASSIGGSSSIVHSATSRGASAQPRTEHPTPTVGASVPREEKSWRQLAAERRSVLDESALTPSPVGVARSPSLGHSPGVSAHSFGVVAPGDL